MPLIIGLGNPGSKYAGTRHNIGFEFIDKLATSLSARMGPGKGPFHVGKGNHAGHSIYLIKPTTYMNNSGDAIQQAVSWYKEDVGNCLVCYDDLDLDIGTLRLRPGGSAGGHNGIKDIINKLGTNSFPRLRIGIGNDFPRGQQVQHVLSSFSDDERTTIESTLDNAVDAALCFVREGIDQTMNKFN
ncbi:aminoacyl-tRNA hydrolase [Aliifodinibius salipaludis]|uniref:Peptidyl-tRNA hydrolase n=1 Tax=Fodinibius salipaludis TaxID=2032627 RepID=A0A2A2G809_9BACT|nr:aminoacyl-tRNA hydrolase [Aliifodinibius salipaludis]PAU92999.1 aminoacyl-tRNA hydrolase [Aliifodinibius salipaludis]